MTMPTLRHCCATLAGLALLLTGCLNPNIGGTGSLGGTGTEASTSSSSGAADVESEASTWTTDGSSTTGTTSPGDITNSSTEAETDTTTNPEPECGNGIVEPGEECDDANGDPNDGCWLCANDRIVFVTSEVYKGFLLQGLAGADARCRMLAALAGLPNVPTYRAWLSTATVAAAERMHHSHGRYTLVNGIPVAYGWHGFTSGELLAPIDVDENSQIQTYAPVWTGTLADGSPALGSDFCNDWDLPHSLFATGGTGRTTAQDDRWSFFFQDVCDGDAPLYCIEN